MTKNNSNVTTNNVLSTMKMSDIKKSLRESASMIDYEYNDYSLLDKEHKQVVDAIESALSIENKYSVVLKDTTSCVLFVVDEHEHTVFNVYDTFRIQFTTAQAKKYKSELLKDKRFYTHVYKNNEFISAKSKDINDFIDLCKYCYKAIETSEKSASKRTSASKKEQAQVVNK